MPFIQKSRVARCRPPARRGKTRGKTCGKPEMKGYTGFVGWCPENTRKPRRCAVFGTSADRTAAGCTSVSDWGSVHTGFLLGLRSVLLDAHACTCIPEADGGRMPRRGRLPETAGRIAARQAVHGPPAPSFSASARSHLMRAARRRAAQIVIYLARSRSIRGMRPCRTRSGAKSMGS